MLLCALITDVSISMGWYLIPLSSSVSSKEPTTYRASCLSATEHRHSKHQQIWRTNILFFTCLFLMLQDIAGSSEEKVRNTHHALPFLKWRIVRSFSTYVYWLKAKETRLKIISVIQFCYFSYITWSQFIKLIKIHLFLPLFLPKNFSPIKRRRDFLFILFFKEFIPTCSHDSNIFST